MLPSFGRFSFLAAMLLGLGCSSTSAVASDDKLRSLISPPPPSPPSDLGALQKKTFHYNSKDIVVTPSRNSTELAAKYPIFAYQPWIKIENGCDPYVLVTEDGRVNSGTNADGDEHPESTGCRTKKRQMYGRVVDKGGDKGQYYIYMLYFPKVSLKGTIQTHSFECIVVKKDDYLAFTSWDNGYYKLAWNEIRKEERKDKSTRTMLKYVTHTTHNDLEDAYLATTDADDKVKDVPMVLWHHLSEEARRSLNSYDFDTSSRNETVCINDNNYLETMKAADEAPFQHRNARNSFF